MYGISLFWLLQNQILFAQHSLQQPLWKMHSSPCMTRSKYTEINCSKQLNWKNKNSTTHCQGITWHHLHRCLLKTSNKEILLNQTTKNTDTFLSGRLNFSLVQWRDSRFLIQRLLKTTEVFLKCNSNRLKTISYNGTFFFFRRNPQIYLNFFRKVQRSNINIKPLQTNKQKKNPSHHSSLKWAPSKSQEQSTYRPN